MSSSTASPSLATGSPVARRISEGVPPLRAGEGRSFLWRRLHSLTGIIPVGAFLTEHFISNAFATNGPHAYADQVKFLTGLPFVVWVEAIFIWLPIAFHSLYGFYIWYRGDSNVFSYPWQGNWMYTAQRWTGAIAFFYMGWHTYTMRFSGVHLITNPGAAFAKVQQELQNPWALAFYIVGITAASWHFGYGLWLFAVKWGFVLGGRSRRRFGVLCTGVTLLFIVVGLFTLRAFFRPEWRNTPLNAPAAQQIEKGARH
jgi:succinate dehydrogenase / fumarate reductase, cytochrome b subunit